VLSLTAGWKPVGSPPSPSTPPFAAEAITATVVGQGIGIARIFVVAHTATGDLYMNQLLVNSEDPTWSGSWTALGWSSTEAASLVGAFGNKVAMAWVAADTNHVNLSLLTPATGTWSPPVEVRAGRAPQLLWDGSGLHLLFVGAPTPLLRHASAMQSTPLVLSAISSISPLIGVKNGQYHAAIYNERVHVAFRQDDGSNNASRILYAKSTTPAGPASNWSIPSETGIVTFNAPRIAAIQHQIFVLGLDFRARIVYSARDMLMRGNDITGNFNSDRWTVAGEELVENGGEGYRQIETLSFNGDIYLTTTSQEEFEGFKAWIVNMSRAAVKRLLTSKLGMRLQWGEPGGGPAELGAGAFAVFGQPALHTLWPSTGEIPLIGDFNGDGSDDIARVTQKAESGVGPAPVYVSLFSGGFQPATLWHRFFSLDTELPLVGDFNGDGKDDLVTFVQRPQAGIGPAPVWVSLSRGDRFQTSSVWHSFFSLAGEVPLVGDVNGDGMDDIITFVQKAQPGIGSAPVWVALSQGNRFGPSQVWHQFFSLAGEVPMVGDVNGDGRDDILTFVQKPQANIGAAPVWVALSQGNRFGTSAVWHTFFSMQGEIPRVADIDLDGRDDIITFLHGNGASGLERVSFVAISTGSRFARSETLVSDFAAPDTLPFIGHFTNATLATTTGRPQDSGRRFPDLVAFGTTGWVNVSFALANYPLPTGAPWERYRWFTDKGMLRF
jgi:hypothetical protein